MANSLPQDDESEPIAHHYLLVLVAQATTLALLWYVSRLFR